MSKVVLTTLNARYTHSSLAIYYLYSVLHQKGYPAVIREYNINQPHLETLTALLAEKADIYCFSVYIWNVQPVRRLIADLHQLAPAAKIVLGGPEVSYNCQKWLNDYPWIDHIVSGQGETALCNIVENKNNPGRIIRGQKIDINQVPFPYSYFLPENIDARYFYYETSRGCPFRCSYCLSSRTDQKLAFRNLDLVYNELDFFVKNGYKHIKLVDRTFNADKKRARHIWSFIKQLYIKYPQSDTGFHFEIHPQLLQEEDFAVLASVPPQRFRFELGIQTLNVTVMKNIHREMNWNRVKENIMRLKKLGNINLHVDLIAGLPGEDITSFAKGFDEVILLGCDQLQLGFLKVLAGTEMEEIAPHYGIVYEKQAPYEVLQTSHISWEELAVVRDIEDLVDKYYNSGKFKNVFAALLQQNLSMWQLLKNLSEFFSAQQIEKKIKKWEKSANALYQYLSSLQLITAEELRDRFRMDWCELSRSHYYPHWLDNELLHNAKFTGYELLSAKRKNGEIDISPSEVRQAIFFIPESDKFTAKHICAYYGRSGAKKKIILNHHPMDK